MPGRAKRPSVAESKSKVSINAGGALGALVGGAPEVDNTPDTSTTINSQEMDASPDQTQVGSKAGVPQYQGINYPHYKQPSFMQNLMTEGRASTNVTQLNQQSALAKASADAELQRQTILEDLRNKNAINEDTYRNELTESNAKAAQARAVLQAAGIAYTPGAQLEYNATVNPLALSEARAGHEAGIESKNLSRDLTNTQRMALNTPEGTQAASRGYRANLNEPFDISNARQAQTASMEQQTSQQGKIFDIRDKAGLTGMEPVSQFSAIPSSKQSFPGNVFYAQPEIQPHQGFMDISTGTFNPPQSRIAPQILQMGQQPTLGQGLNKPSNVNAAQSQDEYEYKTLPDGRVIKRLKQPKTSIGINSQ